MEVQAESTILSAKFVVHDKLATPIAFSGHYRRINWCGPDRILDPVAETPRENA